MRPEITEISPSLAGSPPRFGVSRIIGWFVLRHAVVAVVYATLLLAISPALFAQSALPPEVQADLLKTQVLNAMKAENIQSILASMNQYRELNLPIPPPLLFIEAKAAAKANDPVRAFSALEEYLKTASRDGRQYNEALGLYPQYQGPAHTALAKKAEEERIDAEAKAAALKAAVMKTIPTLLAEIQGAMKYIPAGTFRMGDVAGGSSDHERPVHTVTVKAFKLSAYDVTFAQYDVFAQATGRSLPDDNGWGRGKRPVINVSWGDAEAFAAWLSQQSGLKFRLPTEAEWEYAARAGTTTAYYWGSRFDGSKVARIGDRTEEVGSHAANAFGLYDMSGNVWQWTQDCYTDTYAGAPSDGSAWTSGDCTARVVRGGSWDDRPEALQVSFRLSPDITDHGSTRGFRFAQDN
jgi:formylglycine-generating enzyme required for sulfatase activity